MDLLSSSSLSVVSFAFLLEPFAFLRLEATDISSIELAEKPTEELGKAPFHKWVEGFIDEVF